MLFFTYLLCFYFISIIVFNQNCSLKIIFAKHIFTSMFETDLQQILSKIDTINPIDYGKSRNYINGAVTKLSPYISRGVISTKQVMKSVLDKGYKPYQIDAFLKELAWRDYFQQVWIAIGDDIDNDIKQPQPKVFNHKISTAIATSNTGIVAIDNGINELQQTGYMHNHLRMYTASIACNIASSHWLMPAQWMYYYLLDADWASNACSWQWVASSFSSKKYFANQENVNRYCNTNQTNTFLDIAYEAFENLPIPKELQQLTSLDLKTNLPLKTAIDIDRNIPILIYNFYNLDSSWKKDELANRILLFEPSFFLKYPVSDKTINFVLALAKNIQNIQVYIGECNELVKEYDVSNIYYKEHPTNQHYIGIEEARDWMFNDVKGYYPSFFAYWKKCEKYLKNYK